MALSHSDSLISSPLSLLPVQKSSYVWHKINIEMKPFHGTYSELTQETLRFSFLKKVSFFFKTPRLPLVCVPTARPLLSCPQWGSAEGCGGQRKTAAMGCEQIVSQGDIYIAQGLAWAARR